MYAACAGSWTEKPPRTVRDIAAHKLQMKLVDAEYTLDRGKLVFYFTADNRVDFRELVRTGPTVPHRIELRQIGVCAMARCWAAWACAASRSAAAGF